MVFENDWESLFDRTDSGVFEGSLAADREGWLRLAVMARDTGLNARETVRLNRPAADEGDRMAALQIGIAQNALNIATMMMAISGLGGQLCDYREATDQSE